MKQIIKNILLLPIIIVIVSLMVISYVIIMLSSAVTFSFPLIYEKLEYFYDKITEWVNK